MLNTESGALKPLGVTHQHGACFRFNDGACDAAGRLWIGTLSDAERDPLAHLYCFDGGGCRRVLDGLTVFNGIGWSPAGATMYLIDSPTRRLDAFTFDCATGTIAQRRTVVVFPTELAGCSSTSPCRSNGSAPAPSPAMTCAISPSPRSRPNRQQRRDQPLAGYLFHTRMEVSGVAKHAFAG